MYILHFIKYFTMGINSFFFEIQGIPWTCHHGSVQEHESTAVFFKGTIILHNITWSI